MKKLFLVDPKEELCIAWKKVFTIFPEVEIVCGRFEEINQFDCMVSAANSFGLMDGGVDRAIFDFFGSQLEKRVQERIIRAFSGEQPVGTSFIIETNHSMHPYLAHTPTMRVPMPINGTDNVYHAMKAMLDAVKVFNEKEVKIETVVCPGLGTATGRMSFEIAANQMSLAYKNHKKVPQELSWDFAASRNAEIINAL